MCAGAIAWAGLREVVFGTSIRRLIELGWPQIDIGSEEVLDRAWRLGRKTGIIGGVLEDEWIGGLDGSLGMGCVRMDV